MSAFAPQPMSIVNATTAGDQVPPLTASLADGGHVVAWFSTTDQNIYAQRYDASGARAGGETLIRDGDALAPTGVTGLKDGGFVVLWTQNDSASSSVLVQRLDATGQLVGGPAVVTSSVDGRAPLGSDSVEALPDGGYLVTYHRTFLPPSPQLNGALYAQRFDADGARAGAEITIGSYTETTTRSTTVLPDGGWISAWNEFASFMEGIKTYTAQFSSAGDRVGSSTINPNPDQMERLPDVAVLANGNHVVVWVGGDLLQAQLFGPAGEPLAGHFNLTVAAGAPVAGANPQVTALADGGFLVSWQHATQVSSQPDGQPPHTWGTEVLAQYFDAAGQPAGDTLQLEPPQPVSGYSLPATSWSVTATPDGGFVVGTERQSPDTGWDVYAQKFAPAQPADNTPPAPAPGPVLVPATGGGDTLDGGAGIDTAVVEIPLAGVLSHAIANGVLSAATTIGTLTLLNIERVQLSDALFAFDTSGPDGHVWQAAALFRAGFGAIPEIGDLSRWTAEADRSVNMADLARKMVDAYAPGVSSAALVEHLYVQLVHQQPSAGIVQGFVDQIGPGRPFETQGDLVAYAATHALNTAGLAGFTGSIQPLEPGWF